MGWMSANRVNALVIEGMSYYRARALFPDLARGHPSLPFASLGEQAHYQVAGGKPVFAYRFGSELQTQSIYPGVAACIEGATGTGTTPRPPKALVLQIARAEPAPPSLSF